MKIKHDRNGWLGLALMIVAIMASTLDQAAAQSTAFTYQGRLDDSGIPANGDYDLTFALFDADTAGTQIGATLTNSVVGVSNGLFTVTLDFGASMFTGPDRWLELGVRPSGGTDFALLSPRQAITPAPQAMFSTLAGGVAAGTVVTSLNGLKDDVVLEAGANMTITPNGNTLTLAAVNSGGSGIWSVLNNNAYYNAGNVGIGTANPPERLTIAGVSAFNNGLKLTGSAGAGIGLALENTASGGHKFDILTGGSGTGVAIGGLGIYDETAGNYRLAITSGGNVGIGTTTPATKLTVRSGNSVFSGYGFEHTDGTVRLTTYIDTAYGAWLGTRSNHPLNFFYNDGLPSMTIGGSGVEMVSGLGTVTVGSPNGESGTSIKRNNNRADVRFNGSTLKLVAAPGSGPPPSTYGIAIDTAGNVGIGTESPASKLDVRGTTRTCVLTILGGCDLAEPFVMKDPELSKGSVVVIDEEHPGRLMRSERAYDSRVAGIISGANGINPGITLQQEGTFMDGQNVALSGRVYVMADATNGAIKPGDLLTTSETPGHAMRAADRARSQGAILGKAMSGLKEGRGMVLVLVTLQ
jgi:hypothetical protein